MKQIILFSTLTNTNSQTILPLIFNDGAQHKSLAYMPSDGINNSVEYTQQWQEYAKQYDADFTVINNHSSDETEKAKLLQANILVISGGNTFTLLHNLRASGLDKTITEFAAKPNVTLAGFSAGALILTPSIAIAGLPGMDENSIGLTDLEGLGIMDFEVFPHYESAIHESFLTNYECTTSYLVKTITDEEHIVCLPKISTKYQ